MSRFQGWAGSDVDEEPGEQQELAAEPRGRSLVREIVETALLTLVIFLGVRSIVLNFKVEGLSMAPTLANGQHLLVNRAFYFSLDADLVQRVWPTAPEVNNRVYLFHAPQRGDIVVLWPPASTDRPYIKRLIGLPGETVAIHNGVVTINGIVLDENYIKAPPAYTMAPRTLGSSEYFVLGDNRNNSSDSHLFGAVPADHIVGKAWISYWPSAQLGMVPDVTYAAPVGK